MSGKFIVFEGIDRSGKSTQAKLLQEKLKDAGLNVILTYEPGDSSIGTQIRKILLHSTISLTPFAETLLFEVDRNLHVEEKIKPYIEKDIWVISDRYIYSTIAYQSGGKGVPEELVNSLNKLATGELYPDIVFLIDIDPSTAMKRKGSLDRMEKEGKAFLEKVRDSYLDLARKNRNFVVIDGTLPVEHISDIIWKKILTL